MMPHEAARGAIPAHLPAEDDVYEVDEEDEEDDE